MLLDFQKYNKYPQTSIRFYKYGRVNIDFYEFRYLEREPLEKLI